ncbi:MAG: hypothetical protein R3336_00840 [Phycisphaeraceae bacterium]|nr:hypothetical protein [Phycisphaeraceae bacterium]
MNRLYSIICALLVLAPELVLAQQNVDAAPEQRHWPTVLIAVVLVLCVVAVAMMPTKRTHRD